MESLFGPYLWKFVLVYVDDTIIFSRSPEQHLEDLSMVLRLLQQSGVTLSLSKCYFAQPSLQALGHYVSRLGLSTVLEKTEAIRALKFPETLQGLENGLGFFNYYRMFVEGYAAIAKPLNDCKTRGFRGAPTKGHPREQYAATTRLTKHNPHTKLPLLSDAEMAGCKEAWETLKDQLCDAPTLAFPDFDRPFILYTDGSKERGFGAALH